MKPSLSGFLREIGLAEEWRILKTFSLLLLCDGLRDLGSDEDKERFSQSGLWAGEPWPGAEPVCPRVGPIPEEERSIQCPEPGGTAEFPAVAVRGSESSRVRWSETEQPEKDFWQPTQM